jgi:hypothetical protein
MRIAAAGWVAALLAGTVAAQEEPKPQKEHEWLRQLVGEWESEADIVVDPAKPPEKMKGTESGRMIGGFWAVLENKGDFMGPFSGILTLGYDAGKKKYVGTWIDSKGSTLWHYVGAVDASGKVLTLESEGPAPGDPSKTVKYRESIEVKDKDHKVFTSMTEKDGAWVTFLTVHYRRKK